MRNIGFAGLGIMGQAMSQNLWQKQQLHAVFNRTLSKAAEFAQRWPCQVAQTPAMLAEVCEVVACCVATPKALKDICLGPSGFLSKAKPGQVFVDFSTVSPGLSKHMAQRFAEKNAWFVDAPVTGSKPAAENATLLVMAGGEAQALEKAKPLFEAVGKQVIHCGPSGAGSQMKLANNLVVAQLTSALSEAFLAVEKAGLPPEKYLEVAMASSYASAYIQYKGNAMLQGSPETHFSVELMHKDVGLFLEDATTHGAYVPGAGAAYASFQLALAQGLGQADISSLLKALRLGKP
ncbi:MAG: NAD(P)-dependent oxidoreductase [Proteobacteria bacterium]|nr:NAD(P)-dependent oxidoreductase [Cystobacterineae bacterium]MCL2259499.1 NAD(P)-dependent oxidoreductase [Cystobacterineae bacterium]MCL2314035.1 NAD(P)-dependent oxidoreductase [Pseudomonadota bacterium]